MFLNYMYYSGNVGEMYLIRFINVLFSIILALAAVLILSSCKSVAVTSLQNWQSQICTGRVGFYWELWQHSIQKLLVSTFLETFYNVKLYVLGMIAMYHVLYI